MEPWTSDYEICLLTAELLGEEDSWIVPDPECDFDGSPIHSHSTLAVSVGGKSSERHQTISSHHPVRPEPRIHSQGIVRGAE